MNAMTRDNTIAEIHRIRREIAAKFRGDVFAINADAQARTEASGRDIVRRLKSREGATPSSGRGGAGQRSDPVTAAG